MSPILLTAIIAGSISGVIVIAFFIAIDVSRSGARATASGTWVQPAERTSALKQFEELMRPIACPPWQPASCARSSAAPGTPAASRRQAFSQSATAWGRCWRSWASLSAWSSR